MPDQDGLAKTYKKQDGKDAVLELTRANMKKLALLIGGAILLFWGLHHLDTVQAFLSWGLALIFPLVLGLCIAFVVNVPMQAVEKVLCRMAKKERAGKVIRAFSLVIMVLLVLAVLVLVLFLIIPELGKTFDTVWAAFPGFMARTQEWAQRLLSRYPEVVEYAGNIKFDWESILRNVITFLQSGLGDMVGSTVSVIGSVFSGVTSCVLGIIFAVYVLLQKETLARQSRRVIYAFLKEKHADRFLEICALAHRTFFKFITGQGVEAVILGLMFFVTMTVFQFPYALMIAVLISVTALIPIFGAFIGLVVGALLILVADPVKALWFIILFFVLQQIEGNLIYPKVVGSSIGLPGIWVLAAVTVGGSAFGVVGMLVMVPAFSVLYALLRQETGKRLKKRNLPLQKLM